MIIIHKGGNIKCLSFKIIITLMKFYIFQTMYSNGFWINYMIWIVFKLPVQYVLYNFA